MSLRILVPAIIWVGVVFLFYTGSYNAPCNLWFNCIPGYSFLNVVLFWGFVHIWSGVFRKQLRYEYLRDHAVIISLIIGLVFATLFELVLAYQTDMGNFDILRLFMNYTGALIGVISFKLLYSGC